MNETAKRGRGRPPKYPGESRRQNFSFRIRDVTRDRIIRECNETGRSISEEIEFRLEQSFLELDILERLFGGPETLKFFLQMALGLQQKVSSEISGAGDDWLEQSSEAFRERLVEEFSAQLHFAHVVKAPLTQEEAKATRVRKLKAKMPSGMSWASAEEIEQSTPAKVTEVSAIPDHPPEPFDKSDFDAAMGDNPESKLQPAPAPKPVRRRKAKTSA